MVRLFEDTNIQAIADAIRAKTGSTDTYKTSEMASAIEAIQAGSDAIGIKQFIEETAANVTSVIVKSVGQILIMTSVLRCISLGFIKLLVHENIC